MARNNKVDIDYMINWIRKYFMQNGPDCKAIIGVSGGKDSTVCAALLCRALGPNNVVAVRMPQGIQEDIDMAKEVTEYLGITQTYEVNIGSTCDAIYAALPLMASSYPGVTTNTPARIRMTVLYAIAAMVHGRVCNTCNYSEDYVGYSTKFGDNTGDFSLLKGYTVTQVIEIGRMLGLPEKFLTKPPADGLCGKTDEENLGFSYSTLDKYITTGVINDYEVFKNIETRHVKNLHKVRPMPTLPGDTSLYEDRQYF